MHTPGPLPFAPPPHPRLDIPPLAPVNASPLASRLASPLAARAPLAPIPEARPVELIAVVALIALIDAATYDGAGGAGLAAIFVGAPAIVLVAAEGRRSSRRLVATGALLALVGARCLWQPSAGTALVGAALLLAFAVGLRGGRLFIPELVVSSLGSVFGSFQQLWALGTGAVRVARPWRLTRAPWAAILVPLGLVAVFGAIFTAANPLVARAAATVLATLARFAWFPSPVRVLFWGACALGAAALLRPVCRSVAALDARLGVAHAAPSSDAATSATRLAVARNGLVALNALFLAYNALDAVYLWAGRAPEGVSHTAYAHGGAAWLSIALVASTIVLGALLRGPIAVDPRGRLARGLAYAWGAQNLVLAAGTFRRITMYVAYSGLTELRIVGVLGSALATVGLVIVLVKIARQRTMHYTTQWVLRRQLDAFALAVALYAVAPTGWMAMRYNVARVQADQYRPLLHLYAQPVDPEALSALLPLLDHPDPTVREGVADLIDERAAALRGDGGATAARERWAQWQAAPGWAVAAVDARATRLAEIMPSDRAAARARLRGVAYGVNGEVERPGDEVPFDWRATRYPSRY